jgi:hypothetical protein
MSESTDEWSLKEVHPEESPERWIFRKNLRPTPSPGDAQFGYVAYLTIHFEPRDKTGLPSDSDEAVLFEIEDTGLSEIESGGEASHVASALQNRVKDLLFYIRDPAIFHERASAFRERYSCFTVDWEIIEDPSWEHYEDFP